VRKRKTVDIEGAEKKLRQAGFFVDHLDYFSRQPDYQRRGDPEHLEFFFSASLTAARSVYQVLCHSGGRMFQRVSAEWIRKLTDQQHRDFKMMKNLRDGDVHRASAAAESLPKYVEADFGRHESPYYQSLVLRSADLGGHFE